jgi:multidrug efflux pump subunit AcrA (membrane-fusion protein)
MKNQWLCAVLAAGLLAASGCSKKEESETEAPAPVQVTAVTQEPIRRIVAGDGVLFPKDQTGVMPNISKPVVKFYANRGDHVKQGQLLAVLESRDLAAAVDNAKSQFNQAELNFHTVDLASVPESLVKAQTDVESDKEQLDAAQKLLDSRTELFKQGALAGRQVDEARVQFASAKAQWQAAQEHLHALNSVSKGDQVSTARAQVQAAQATVLSAEAQVGYAQIHSPISGIVSDRPLYEGEMAVPGTPLITVVDISQVVARVNIPQTQGALVKVGQSAELVQGENGQQFTGKVIVVSPATDPNSTTIQVWIQADNPGEKLKPGASVHAKIIAEEFKNATTVPAAAILPGETGGTAVLVIIDSVAHRRPVQVGVREGDKVQILNGCRPGEEVVTVGGLGVDDKGKVKVIDASVQESDDEDQNAPPAADSKKDTRKDEAKPKAK